MLNGPNDGETKIIDVESGKVMDNIYTEDTEEGVKTPLLLDLEFNKDYKLIYKPKFRMNYFKDMIFIFRKYFFL